MIRFKKNFFLKPSFFITAGAVVVVTALTIAGILWVRKIKTPAADAERCIPPDALLVAFVSKPSGFYAETKQNFLWHSLNAFPWMNDVEKALLLADSAGSGDKKISDALRNNRLIVSLHKRNHEIAPLLMLQFPDVLDDKHTHAFINKSVGAFHSCRSLDTLGSALTIVPARGKSRWIFCVFKGLAMASTEPALIYDALGCASGAPSWADDPVAGRMLSATGKKAGANLFFDWKNFTALFEKALGDENSAALEILTANSLASGFDIRLKNQEILLNGYLYPASSEAGLGKLLDGLQPRRITLASAVPGNAAMMIYFGCSDLSHLAANARNLSQINNEDAQVLSFSEKIKNDAGFDTEADFLSLLSGEAGIVDLPAWEGSSRESKYVLFGIRDTTSIREVLRKYTDDHQEWGQIPTAKLRFSGLLSGVFGSSLRFADNYRISLYGKHLIFGASHSELQHYVWLLRSGKTLENNKNFIAFSSLLPEKANMLIYADTKVYSYPGKNEASGFLQKISAGNGGLQAFALQLSAEQNRIFAGMYLKGNSSYVAFHPALLEISTTEDIQWPSAAVAGKDSSLFFTFFDKAGYMIVTDAAGKRLLHIKTEGKPLGPVTFCDPLKDGSIYLLYNSSKTVYMIGLNGKTAAGFPYRLPSEAATALSLFDYDHKKDYRILIPMKNGDLLNIDAKGKPVSGWAKPNIQKAAKHPALHFVIKGKDYIFLTNADGKPWFFDRRGRTNVKPKTDIVLSEKISPAIHYNHQVQASGWIVAGKQGGIFSLSPDGSITELRGAGHTSSKSLLFTDFSGNGAIDVLLLHNDSVVVYTPDQGRTASYRLSGAAGFAGSGGSLGLAQIYLNNSTQDSVYVMAMAAGKITKKTLEGKFAGIFRGVQGNIYLIAVADKKILVYLIRAES